MGTDRNRQALALFGCVVVLFTASPLRADAAGAGPPGSFREASRKALPGVVTVRVDSSVRAPWLPPTPMPGPFNPVPDGSRRLFGRGSGDPSVEGAGIVLDAPKGYILTSDQLIGPGSRPVVLLPDGRGERVVSQVRRDPRSGLALLVIDPAGLLPVAWDDAPSPEVGDWLAAVSRPAGSSGRVSAGVVSAVGEASETSDEALVWTDALAAPGSPLVDGNGRLMAVVVQVPAAWGGTARGFAAAVPATRARRVVAELAREGVVRRGYLGVTIGMPDRQVLARLGADGGVLVVAVAPDSPAARAGVRPGDVILRVNDTPTRNDRELRAAVQATDVGTPFTVTLDRDGRRETLRVAPNELRGPGAPPAPAPMPDGVEPGRVAPLPDKPPSGGVGPR